MKRYKPGDRVVIPAEICAVHEYRDGSIVYTVEPMNSEPDDGLYDYMAKHIIGEYIPNDDEEA